MKEFFRRNLGLIVVIIFSLPTIFPFFAKGFFPMHDDTQVQRVYEMATALSDGHFPVRWVKDLGYGYGYPLFNFYAPLPYYVGGIINVVGINVLDSTKAMMVLGILLSGIFMYFLAREFWGEIGGIVSALLYVYAPYHAVDIYARGAVGEFWAYAFLPLFALGIWKIHQAQKERGAILGAIGFAAVILSHNLTAMMVAPFLMIALLLIVSKNKSLVSMKYYVLSILLGLGFSAFYWLPAVFEMRYTNVLSQVGGTADFRDHFVCWQQLWESQWGFGGSVPGCVDGLSFSIGKMRIILLIPLLFFLLKRLDSKAQERNAVFFGLFVLAASIFMTLSLSKPVWELTPILAFLQYPWRFLLFSSFALSFLIGCVFRFVSSRPAYAVGIIFIVLLLFSNGRLFQPKYVYSKNPDEFVTQENIKWVTSKISDEYMPKDFAIPKNENDIVHKRIDNVLVLTDKTNRLVFTPTLEKEENLLVKIAPFPAWKVYVDDGKAQVLLANNGIGIALPKGTHTVQVVFESTAIEALGNILSIVSIAGLLGGIVVKRKYGKS